MANDTQSENVEDRLASMLGRNDLVFAELEHLSDRDLESYNKQSLVFLAGLFNVSYSGLSETKLRNKLKKRRDKIRMIAATVPTLAPPETPNEDSDPPHAPVATNPTNQAPPHFQDDQSDGRSSGDPPGATRSSNDPINNTGKPETPGQDSRSSFPTTIDVSAYVRANMEAAGLDPRGGLDYSYMGVTRRDLDIRERQQRLDLDERDNNMREHIKQQLDENFEVLRLLIVTQNQQSNPNPNPNDNGPGGFSPIHGKDPDAAPKTSFSASGRWGNRFGATSPTDSFRGRPVNLDAVEEESMGHGRSPIMSPPLGGRANRYFQSRYRDEESITSNQRQFHPPRFNSSYSPLNDPRRGDLYHKYLGGIDGLQLTDITPSFLGELGYEGQDVKNTILRDVASLLDRWDTPDVNPKYYSGFSKLEELNVESFIDFYNHIQHQLKRYHIGLMPFDCIIPKWHHVGMTYPGMGEIRYVYQAETLFNILEKLLPKQDTIVKQCITTLLGSSHDGFKLLHLILGKSVPVFCLYKPSIPPKWQDHEDVAQMAKLWKLHFRLESKTGSNHSPIQQSLMFLQSLDDPILSPHLTSIRSSIQIFTETMTEHDETNVSLPINLTIDGITTTLTSFPATMNSTFNYATSNNFSMVTFAGKDTDLDMQGFVSNATTNIRSSTRSRTPRRGKDATKPQNPNKDVVCRGCHKKGHVKVECRELAKWIILSQAVKQLPDHTRKKVLESYHRHYSTAPPNPTIARSYRDILNEFCSNRNMTTDQVIAHYNWDAFIASNSDSEDEGFETAAEGEDDSE